MADLYNARTLPLIKYLLRSQAQLKEDAGKNLISVIRKHAGEDQDPIDESFIKYKEFMSLIQDSSSTKFSGKSVGQYLPMSRDYYFHRSRRIKNNANERQVTIVGAGVSGLCTAFELKRRGFNVRILEASSRVGGRVITFRDPVLAPGIHAEGGAMRIPHDHFLLRKYIQNFGLEKELFPFEMQNKFIYLSGMPEGHRTLKYKKFERMLTDQDPTLMALFPGLTADERGKTSDQLFDAAVKPVRDLWEKEYNRANGATADETTDDDLKPNKEPTQDDYNEEAIQKAYAAVTAKYDHYSLRSYLTDVAGWSLDAISLYDLSNAHVVFENGFIESFKDAFLSTNKTVGGMEQLQSGMDAVPKGFLNPYPEQGLSDSLLNNITFGARVKKIGFGGLKGEVAIQQAPIKVYYDNGAGEEVAVESDYLVLAIPYTSQRSITKERTFAPLQEMAIRDVRYVEVTKVILQYSQRWWKHAFSTAEQGFDGGVVCDLPIRYTMFPVEKGNDQFENGTPRGAVMAAYTFEQDATILGALTPERRIQLAARNLDTIFPGENSLALLEASASQVFPADENAGGSAFCYFGPSQKETYLETMMATDWEQRAFFAGEQASYTHGWIQGALEAALRCVGQIMDAANTPVQ